MARLVCEHILLGEPRSKGAAVVLFHPSAPKSEMLKVLHAALPPVPPSYLSPLTSFLRSSPFPL